MPDSANLTDPDVIAAEFAEGLQAALDQFAALSSDRRVNSAMSVQATERRAESRSVRRNVNRKILAFSLFIGAATTVLAAFGYVATIYPSLRRYQRIHQHIFDEITCTETTCDTSVFTNDWKSGSADYIIYTRRRYFIDVPQPTEERPGLFAPLDYSDTAFIAQFREPAWYPTPDGEVWRLYSRESQIDNQKLDIIVGFAWKAAWKMVDTSEPDVNLVDATLRNEADKLAASPRSARTPRGAAVDGYEIVDATTQKVLDWGPWLPIFLPPNTRLPNPGIQPYLQDGDLYVVRSDTDTDGRLIATTLILVNSLLGLALGGVAILFFSSGIAWLLSRRFLRGYFALRTVCVLTLEEALREGEGQAIEFKRRLSDDPLRTKSAEDELLKSIAAFANTNDGVIFVGVDDSGRIVGLELDFKQKDRLEQKIRQLARNRIRPIPVVQVGFEDARGLQVARVTVPRGEEPAYMIGGVIYVRNGSSDVQAQPEDLRKLFVEYTS